MQGTLDELKSKVLGAPEYEVKFSREWDANGLDLPTGMMVLDRTATSLKVRVERPQESNPQLINILSARSAPVMSLQESPRSLEQVYLKVMAEIRGGIHVG
jgi:ABC-2 type transport system ATP-binding protein